jgi:hypothetical protein
MGREVKDVRSSSRKQLGLWLSVVLLSACGGTEEGDAPGEAPQDAAPAADAAPPERDARVPRPRRDAEVDPPTEDAAVVDPPVDDAAVVDPPVDDAAVVDPPVDDAAIVDPPTDDAAVVDPPTDDAAVVDPPVDDAAVVDPPADDAAVVDPPVDDAAVVDPPADAAVAVPPFFAEGPSPIIDDAEWADPTIVVVEPPQVDPPVGTPYAVLPDGWIEVNRARYADANTPKSLLQIGDSISESQAFLAIEQWEADSPVARANGYVHLPKDLATMAGQESSWGAEVVDEALATARAELTSVMFGTNNARRGGSAVPFADEMAYIVDACIGAGTLPILMTIPPIDGDSVVVTPFNDAVRALAASRQIPLFDLHRFLVDRDDLARDVPDGLHPSLAAYRAINTEWLRLYALVEYEVLRPERPAAPDPGVDPNDPLAADLALVWRRVLDQDFSENEDLTGWRAVRGDWAVENGLLQGLADPDDAAIMLTPARVPGPTRMEISVVSADHEQSMLLNNAGDLDGVLGWYFGFGTNGGARTAVNFDDVRVDEIIDARPLPNIFYNLRAYRSPMLARFGWNGERYAISYRTTEDQRAEPANRDRNGLYTWGGRIAVRRIVVWAGERP